MIRNDKEYRYSKEQLSELEAELQKLSPVQRSAERDEVASAVIDALRMQIEDLEREISEYEDLKEGRLLSFGTEDLNSLDVCCVVCKVKRGPSEFPVQRSFRWPNPSLPHSWPSWKRP
jgi:HTH-type transcriptional regulator / antitoxin HigA